MGGYVGAGKQPIALFDAYTKGQADGLFPDKTSATPQDFAAMPSVGGDPMVESGSNSDGEWTRWADGTLIMGKQIILSVTYGNGIEDGGTYFSGEVSFNFPSANVGTMKGSGSHSKASNGFLLNCIAQDTREWKTFIYRAQNFTTGRFDAPIELVAIGRWK